jgi:hypothetical protein
MKGALALLLLLSLSACTFSGSRTTNQSTDQTTNQSGSQSPPTSPSQSSGPSASQSSGTSVAGKPQIHFASEKIDLGKVEAAVEVPCAFTISNTGNAPLEISSAKSECGCTATNFKGAILAPGKSIKLDIIVDTTMKQGPVTKDMVVYSDDPERPIARLYIAMDVKNAHGTMTLKERTKIFTAERCKSCHVDEGVGQFGKELFEADCAMCHRTQESGILSGPVIESVSYANAMMTARARDIISHGSKTSPSMPGFLDVDGGPLSKEQVESLVQYLKKPHPVKTVVPKVPTENAEAH